MRISVITTKRAYEELENEGFIYTLPGKGSFVAKANRELLREENLRKIEEHLEAVLELAQSCKMGREEIIEMLDCIMEEGQ